jgi:hypothetical protein
MREARHIARTSSVNLHMRRCMRVCSYAKQREPTHVHASILICKAASMHWRTGDERKAENRPPRGSWGRAIFARSSGSIELLYMKMHDNIPANRRPCMGALQTRARAKEDPQEASIHLHCVCRHQLGNKSPHARAHLRKPLRLRYIYPTPMLVRVRESAIADYAPPTINVEKIFSKSCTTSFHA